MSTRILLELAEGLYTQLHRHLIRRYGDVEQAAFGFAEKHGPAEDPLFRLVDWQPVPSEGFAVQTAYHFELSDEMRASVIKRAHDLGACLVEFHCHLGRWPASFSPSDRTGFEEFVPHVWWRLKGRPYIAVVVSRSSHDGLVWLEDPRSLKRLDGLLVGGRVLRSSGLTRLSMDDEYE
jgi:hypothetical protein